MPSAKIIFVLFSVSCLALASANAQQADSLAAYNSDELFAKGRSASFDGNREKGRVYLMKALEKSPDYVEIRVFLARTYLWDDMPDKAKETLAPLLNQEPVDLGAAKVMFDAAYWNDDSETALLWANKGLDKNPADKDMLINKAKALGDLERYDEGLEVLDILLQRFPGDKAVLSLWETFKTAMRANSITASASYDFYSKIFGNASLYSLQYGRRTSIGSIFLRANESNRFSTNGWQIEADAYPSIAKGVYAYLNYGFSPTSLFPNHRAGGEVYVSLPWAFEASGGFRYLYFGKDSGFIMYTGTLGKYYRSLWFSARVFITPDPAGASKSLGLQVRRYFSNANNYVGITGGFGFSPDFRNLQSNDGFSSSEIYKLRAWRIGADYQQPVGDRWLLLATVGYASQEYLFDVGNYVGITSCSVTARYQF